VSGVTVAHYSKILPRRIGARPFPAPSDWRVKEKFQQTSGEWRREIARLCHPLNVITRESG